MKLRSVITLFLLLSLLLSVGCSDKEAASDDNTVVKSPNFSFDVNMTTYMEVYTEMEVSDEMFDAGANAYTPLSEQFREDGTTWADYISSMTIDSIKKILVYCEAAHADKYTITEGMRYKSNESVAFFSDSANEAGIPVDEYLTTSMGEDVTFEALKTCSQMMALCEGYEIDLLMDEEVSVADAEKYVEEHIDDFLKFNALRFTTKNKAIADKLAAAEDRVAFLKIVYGISGTDITDLDKNGTPDSVEVNYAPISSDISGKFASAEGREIYDTEVVEKDGEYTVTMLLSLPKKNTESVWDLRLIYISSASSTDPLGDAKSLLDQWKEKKGGEEGFSNLAARYSDNAQAYYGGLLNGATAREMPNSTIVSWMSDTSRKAGDTTVIEDGSNGAYMLYYIGDPVPDWQYEAIWTLKNERVEKKMADFEKEISEKITVNEDAMKKIMSKR